MANFININELKGSVLNANLDDEYIQPAIDEAQNIYLREIIGDALYNAIENKINDNNLTGKYATLVNNYIKPFLTYKVQSLMVIPVTYKLRNAGVVNQYDQGFNTTTVKDTAYMADYYNDKAEFYANRLTEYLSKNTADIPEYAYSTQNITNPTPNITAGTIYLGGGRKRSCGANYGGSGGSVETVDWDNIQNRPDFAEVATSGDYNDLDNRPAIPTVSDATINIYQGSTLKGSFSLNQENGQNINLEAGGSGSTDWSDIQNKPNFATVATSGDYNDLQNKPTIPTVPTNVSAFNNDAGYTTFDGDYNSLTNKPTIPAAQVQSDWNANSGMGEILNKPSLATVATSGDYNDLQNKPSIPAPQVQADWQQNDSTQPDYIKNRPSMPSAQIQSDWNQTNTSEVDYIKNKPTIPAAQVQSDWNANSGMGEILNKPSLATVATSGNYSDLNGKPTIPAAPVQSDWNENDNTSLAYIQNKPSIPAAQIQSDWNQSDNTAADYIKNKPSIPVVPSYTTETWTFTLQDNTTVTKTVYLVPSV